MLEGKSQLRQSENGARMRAPRAGNHTIPKPLTTSLVEPGA